MRWRRLVGVMLALASLALATLGVFLDSDQAVWVRAAQWGFGSLMTGVGLVLILKRPLNPIGYVIESTAVGFSMMGLAQPMTRIAMSVGRPVEAVLWAHAESAAWVVMVVSFLCLLPLWFPTGRSLTRRWASFTAVVIASAVIGIILDLFRETICVEWPPEGTCLRWADTPWGIHNVGSGDGIGAFLVVLGVPSLVSLVLRWRRSSGIERVQMKWLVASFSMLVLSYVAAEVVDIPVDFLVWLAAPLVPLSIAVAVLKYRLFEIDRIISRTLTYGLVIALLGLAVSALAAVVGTRFSDPLVVAGTTLAVAAFFTPVRVRIQRIVERRFNRSRFDSERVMEAFSGSLRDQIDPDEVVAGWLDVVAETMQPSTLGMWRRDGSESVHVPSVGVSS